MTQLILTRNDREEFVYAVLIMGTFEAIHRVSLVMAGTSEGNRVDAGKLRQESVYPVRIKQLSYEAQNGKARRQVGSFRFV